jgi:hypothetical protein
MDRWLLSSQPRRPATITACLTEPSYLEEAALESHQPQRRRAASPLGVTTKPKGRQPTGHTANGAR